MRNKFYSLLDQVNANADVLMVTETKLINGQFINGQFIIPGYNTPYRSDRNPAGLGIMLCMTEHTP